jgi:hypothetical protein
MGLDLPYIYGGLQPIGIPTIDQIINIHLIFTLCIGSSIRKMDFEQFGSKGFGVC